MLVYVMGMSASSREPRCGRANQPGQGPCLPPDEWPDPALFSRKGRLYLLCTQDVDESVIESISQRYYSDSRYDVLPALRAALDSVYAGSEGAGDCIPIAVVMVGLKAFALATEKGSIWLVRSGGVEDLLTRHREMHSPVSPPSNEDSDSDAPWLFWAQRHLMPGDALVITTRQTARGLTSGDLQRALRSTSAASAARRLARVAAKASGVPHPPVMVIRLPGLSPVPAFEPSRVRAPARIPREQDVSLRPRRERSPIWLALALAVVAVAISLWLTKPEVSRQDLRRLLISQLTPASTTTLPLEAPPAEGTPTPLATPRP